LLNTSLIILAASLFIINIFILLLSEGVTWILAQELGRVVSAVGSGGMLRRWGAAGGPGEHPGGRWAELGHAQLRGARSICSLPGQRPCFHMEPATER